MTLSKMLPQIFKKIINHRHFFSNRSGQSLIEIMIGLGIGALLIGSAVLSITFTLRSSSSNQALRLASELNQDLLERVRSFGKSDWQKIYSLGKGDDRLYFLNSSGSSFIAVEGKEGKLENDIVTGLSGHWIFDEVETASVLTYDASGNGNNGTVNGALRSSSGCKISNCLNFDGIDDYVDLGSGETLNINQKITLGAWIKLNSYTSGGINTDRANIVQKTGQYYMTVNSGNGTLDIFFQSITGDHLSSNSAIPLNRWVHTLVSYDGSNIKWFIDGALDKILNTSGSIASDSRSVKIGGESGFGRFLNGSIDDVRIYSRDLSDNEIKRLYNSLVFERFFFIENMCRSNDVSSTLIGTSPCSSGFLDDPSTQKITARSQWVTKSQVLAETSLVDYLTRWQNRVFRQTDWSGGSGEDGPILEPSSRYSSSSNIDNISNPGSLKIQGLNP